MARKRYRWDIFCDKYPVPESTYFKFFDKIAHLRPLFYPMSVIQDWPDEFSGHDSNSQHSDHDEDTSEDFHFHIKGRLPVNGITDIVVFESFIFLYLVSITVQLVYLVKCKPRIQNSYKKLRNQKWKFCCGWGIAAFLSILVNLALLVSAFMIR